MPRPRLSKDEKRRRQLIRRLRVWARDKRNFMFAVAAKTRSIALFADDIETRNNQQLNALLDQRLRKNNDDDIA